MTIKKMTKEEIMSFQGHEFIYEFPNGDTMPAYIKKIDLKKELISCWSFSLITKQGYEFKPIDAEEEAEGACCLAWEDNKKEMIKMLTEIKTTGKLLYNQTGTGSFNGCPF